MWVIPSCAARNVWLLATAYLGAGPSERGISGFHADDGHGRLRCGEGSPALGLSTGRHHASAMPQLDRRFMNAHLVTRRGHMMVAIGAHEYSLSRLRHWPECHSAHSGAGCVPA